MRTLRPERRRVQLDQEAYSQLRQQIMARDGWRCQACGSPTHPHIHHIQSRSRIGDDVDENLITLCSCCHQGLHRGKTISYGLAR